ncbi:MAG: N-acetylglucosamine-6-phosphate deacetylase [Marmoricola sp.]
MSTTDAWVLRAQEVLTPHRRLCPGWVSIRGARIDAVGSGSSPSGLAVLDVGARVLTPGFVDLHVHGGDGAQVNGATPDEVTVSVATVAGCHLRHGTTALLATTVADSPARLLAAVRGIAAAAAHPAPEAARVLGAHLEGPWLAPSRAGAQDPLSLRPPSVPELAALLDAARETVRLLSLAPELPGAFDLIRAAAGDGLVVSVGHTEADWETTNRAFDAGARHVTHLFNAMPGVHHRRPGPVVAALDDPRVSVEIIADGIHIHPAVLARVLAAAPGRVAAVTDAMAATGLSPGRYRLGRLDVILAGGRVALAEAPETLAGSVLTMDRAVKVLVDAGVGLTEAVTAATATPARVIGEATRGRLESGAEADLVVLEQDLSVAAVLRAGRAAHDPQGLLRQPACEQDAYR